MDDHPTQHDGDVRQEPLDVRSSAHPELKSCTALWVNRRTDGLTNAQREVFLMLLEDPQPTCRDIARRRGTTNGAAVDCHLLALEKKGYIRRRPDRTGRDVDILRPLGAWPRWLRTTGGAVMRVIWT